MGDLHGLHDFFRDNAGVLLFNELGENTLEILKSA